MNSITLALLSVLIALCIPNHSWGQSTEELVSQEAHEQMASNWNKIQRVENRLLFQNNEYEYSDLTLYRLVSPVPKSKRVMQVKMVTKTFSLVAMAIGTGVFLYYTGEGMFVDGAGANTGELRKNALIVTGSGFGGLLIQVPLSKVSISIFNKKTTK